MFALDAKAKEAVARTTAWQDNRNQMKVLIDAISIRQQKAGVGVYAYNLIANLLLLDSASHYFIVAQNDDPDLDFSYASNVTMIWISARIFRSIPLRMVFEQIALPWLLLKHSIRLIHSLHYSFPLLSFGAKQVVTLHDMTSFYMPEYHVPIKRIYFRFFIRAAVRWADSIIFVSESARIDCERTVGKPRGMSFVVYHGKSEQFRNDFDPLALTEARERYGLPPSYVLYIGTIEPRKNLRCLVRAFANATRNRAEISLVLAGMKGWNNEFELLQQTIQSLNMANRVILPGYVPEEDKPLLLAAATVFVYPSLYEGFGLPVLEALACGTPTITSNTSSIPEVAGDGALLVDPADELQVQGALETLLSNSIFRTQLKQKAVGQASCFSWQKTAIETYRVYRLT